MTNISAAEVSSRPNANLFRRLGAMLYDGLLIIAIWMIGTAVLLPFTQGQALNTGLPAYRAYLFLLAFGFYGWFWTHGGQTLGMKTWKLHVVRDDGYQLNWANAFIRFVAALISWLPMGLGFWWSFIEADKRTWHDRLSNSRVLDSRPKTSEKSTEKTQKAKRKAKQKA